MKSRDVLHKDTRRTSPVLVSYIHWPEINYREEKGKGVGHGSKTSRNNRGANGLQLRRGARSTTGIQQVTL